MKKTTQQKRENNRLGVDDEGRPSIIEKPVKQKIIPRGFVEALVREFVDYRHSHAISLKEARSELIHLAKNHGMPLDIIREIFKKIDEW